MLIKNLNKLAKTKLRRQVLKIIEAGLRAINPKVIVLKKIKLVGNKLSINDRDFDLKSFKRVFFVGIGKAALSAAFGIEKILGPKIVSGICLDILQGKLKYIKSFAGDHPFPTQRNIEATAEIKKLLSGLHKDDLVLTAISGGGSALLCSLPKSTCEEESFLTSVLFERGASIEEINTIRKHLSDLKGGGLAKLVFPATLIGLIFSDTPGCALDTVASGPTIYDPTNSKEAKKILKKYSLPQIDLLETPKEKKYFREVSNFLMMCNMDALAAMHAQALTLGFKAKICGNCLSGEAREVGRTLVKTVGRGEMIIGGGETVVIVKGKGRGGRNQELVLGALPFLSKKAVIVSINTDGFDNTNAAGALGDELTLKRAKRLGLEPKKFLAENDSYHFFQKTGNLIFTGPTGTNVSDLVIVAHSA